LSGYGICYGSCHVSYPWILSVNVNGLWTWILILCGENETCRESETCHETCHENVICPCPCHEIVNDSCSYSGDPYPWSETLTLNGWTGENTYMLHVQVNKLVLKFHLPLNDQVTKTNSPSPARATVVLYKLQSAAIQLGSIKFPQCTLHVLIGGILHNSAGGMRDNSEFTGSTKFD